MKSQFDENRREANLSGDDMKLYLDRKMDAAEMYDVEYKLQEDGFHAAAMEGYENNPDALNDLNDIKSAFYNKLPVGKFSFWQQYRVYLSAAAVILAIVATVALMYYFQPTSEQISQKIEHKEELALVEIEKTEQLQTEDGDEQKRSTLAPVEKKEEKVVLQNKIVQKEKVEIAEKPSEKKSTQLDKRIEEEVPDIPAEEKSAKDEIQAGNDVMIEKKSEQVFSKLAVAVENNMVDSESAYDLELLQETEKKVVLNTAITSSIKAPEMDFNERSKDETTVTYLLDLKVIDYTQVYEKQIERTRMVYKPGISARYANKRAKAQHHRQRKIISDEVLDSVTYIDVLKESLAYYKSGAYEKSLSNFAIILKKHPEELNGKFYGGIGHFEMGNYKKALKNFDFVIEHPIDVFNPEGEWFKAQTLVRIGKLNKAKELLQKIISEQGFYSEKAKLLLDEIQQ